MRTLSRHADRHQITFHNHVLDRDLDVRDASYQAPSRTHQPVIRNESWERVNIMGIENGGDEFGDQIFVLVRTHGLTTTQTLQ